MAYKQKGFTILELMIAIAVMGVVMLLVTMGVIQVSRYFKQAQTKTALLNATRELHAQFAQDMQYSGADPTKGTITSGAYRAICVGTSRYLYNINDFGTSPIYKDTIIGSGECLSKPADTSFSPMPPETHVTIFDINPTANGAWLLDTRFVSANGEDIFVGADYNNECAAAAAGGQFCAVSKLSSTLVRKVAQ